MFSSCSREPELLNLLRSGGWPLGGEPELHAHVRTCQRCTEVVLVSGALQQLCAETAPSAPLPDPGILWWRAAIRRRADAVERMNQPLAGAQVFALGLAAVTLIGLIVTQAHHGLQWLAWWSGMPEPLQWLGAHGTNLLVVIPALATLAVVGGMAAWLAMER